MMKKIVATPAPEFRTEVVRYTAWVYAAVLTFMAVGQLFAFEKFIPLLQDYQLPGGYGTAALIGSLAVITEIFALPFLLGMSLSPLMRWVSRAFCVIAPAIWLALALHACAANIVPANGGIFGTHVTVSIGLQLALSVIYLALAIYVAIYGVQQKHKK